MEAYNVNLCAALSCCALSNQSLFRLVQHGNSQRGVEVQCYMREKETIFLFLFEVNMSIDCLSALLYVAVTLSEYLSCMH